MQQREARDGMGVPRSDLETGDGRRGKAGEASASIIVDLGETRTRRRREGMNRRENWRGMIEGGGGEGKEKQRGRERRRSGEASKRKEKDSRVVLLLDEIEFLFDPLASVSHREFQPSRSPAASSATLQQKERGGGEKKGENKRREFD